MIRFFLLANGVFGGLLRAFISNGANITLHSPLRHIGPPEFLLHPPLPPGHFPTSGQLQSPGDVPALPHVPASDPLVGPTDPIKPTAFSIGHDAYGYAPRAASTLQIGPWCEKSGLLWQIRIPPISDLDSLISGNPTLLLPVIPETATTLGRCGSMGSFGSCNKTLVDDVLDADTQDNPKGVRMVACCASGSFDIYVVDSLPKVDPPLTELVELLPFCRYGWPDDQVAYSRDPDAAFAREGDNLVIQLQTALSKVPEALAASGFDLVVRGCCAQGTNPDETPLFPGIQYSI